MWWLLFLLVGCGEVARLEGPSEKAPVGGYSSLEPVPELKAEVKCRQDPNQYAIQLTWKESGILSEEWWISRTRAAGNHEVIARLSSQQKEHTDSAVVAGADYVYELRAYDSGSVVSLATARVTIPTDWVPGPGVHRFPEIPYGRWYLGSQTVVEVGEVDRRVHLLELHSEGAIIQSFPEAAEAGAGSAGRYGGKISIDVERAVGTLDLVSRGEAGGDGLTGEVGSRGSNGADAVGGKYIVHTDVVNRRSPFPLGQRVPISEVAFELMAPQNATKGGPGKPGAAGGKGGNGGDCGGIELFVKDSKEFFPRPLSVGGRGGRPGFGGLGGRGGRGGRGVANQCLASENPACKSGEDGEDGPLGAMGSWGEPGKAGPVLLRIDGVERALR